MSSEQYLPWPKNRTEIQEHLRKINPGFLYFKTEDIVLEVDASLNNLIENNVLPIGSPGAKWVDIYSIYHANQQLNEACNKLWAGIEITNMINPNIWGKRYPPVGTKFDGVFIFGTVIPTIYYSLLSAIMANLSIFGVIPVMLNNKRYFMIRTQDGWKSFIRSKYVKHKFNIKTHSEHEIIIKTFENLRDEHEIDLPAINLHRTIELKKLRNEMQYEILADLKMWRPYENEALFYDMIPFVIDSVSMTIDTIKFIKRVTTRCDKRFEDLIQNCDYYCL